MNHRPPNNMRSIRRSKLYREENYLACQEAQQLISKEIMAATEKLAQRMPFEPAYRLACQTADEIGAGFRSWEKVKPVREALAKLTGPGPLVCPECGAAQKCQLCGHDPRTP